MNRFLSVFVCFALMLFYSCVNGQESAHTEALWRGVLQTPGGKLPFNFTLLQTTGGMVMEVRNGDETIAFEAAVPKVDKSDTIVIRSALFNSAFYFKQKDAKMHGYWQDFSRPTKYQLPFDAMLADYRFHSNPKKPVSNISGKWDIILKEESSSENTVGVFKQDGNHLTGTLLTTTGDYRFLEGEVDADSFFLSAFDGSHAFLFKGKISSDSSLIGGYWSGQHFHTELLAHRNDHAELPDAKSLTFLKEGFSEIAFSFPDAEGKKITLEDEQFKNKAIVILITGSWCPNCMDEASFMSEVEENYKDSALAIIALSFERQPDPENFKKNIERIRSFFGINYTILNAGLPKTASDALPMLNHILGFPTTIILNRNHSVREIYTGFSGPATGALFLEYQRDFAKTIYEAMQ